jgi:glyoxylase-like metal-dependent hydrolase (beta-lactamase superfamily II)
MIPFVRDFAFDYARVQGVSPLIRRIVARNPGPFTFTGTGTYLIGRDEPGAEVFVIDPGPELDEHLDAILEATAGQRLTRIFVTHAHMDHSPLARVLAGRTGAVIYAGPEPCQPSNGAIRLEAGDDLSFRPDVPLRDGDLFSADGWTLEALATPGHTASHYGYVLQDEQALFPGDCVMGWSTTIISPPDGDMGAYMATLARIRARSFSTLWPTHGPPITQPGPFLDAYIAHRRQREAQIIAALARHGSAKIRTLVPELYAGIETRLYPAASHSMLAHLIELVRRGAVACDGAPAIGSVYRSVRTDVQCGEGAVRRSAAWP